MYAATASSSVMPLPNDTTVVIVVSGTVVVVGAAVVVDAAADVLVPDEPVGVRRPSEFPDPEHRARRTAPTADDQNPGRRRRVTRAA